jgi:predicted transglutaminase-like cysteine proteinase
MGRFAAVFAAICLVSASAPPALAHCPPMTALQQKILAYMTFLDAGEPVNPAERSQSGISAEDLTPFCKREPKAVLCAGGGGRKLTFAEVTRIDAKVRADLRVPLRRGPVRRDDRWAIGVSCGDCEDYALTVSEALHAAGEAGGSMRLMLWLAPFGLHATLVVDTADAGVVELGVNPGETPDTYDEGAAPRFGAIRMDGRQKVLTFPGYKVTRKHDAIVWIGVRR